MSDTAQSLSLTIADIETAKAGLMATPPVWPGPGPVDAAGVQLLVAAMRAGMTPPAHLVDDPDIAALWAALALDAVLPLTN